MARGTEHGRIAFDQARRRQESLAPCRVGPACIEVGHHEAGTFDVEDRHVTESRLGELLGQVVGTVEVRHGEQALDLPAEDARRHRVPHPAGDVGLVDAVEADQEIEQRRMAADGGGEENARRTQDASCLPQRPDAIGTGHEVVERAELQDRIEAVIPLVERSGVAQHCLHARTAGGRLFDVERDGIDQSDGMSRRGEPIGVHAGTAAHVEDAQRTGRKVTEDEFLGAFELEGTRREGAGQPVDLGATLVVLEDGGIELCHPEIMAAGWSVPARCGAGGARLGMGDLADDTAVESLGDGRYRAVLRRDWQIWGPMGGYVAACALRAVGEVSAHPMPAALSCHYLGVAEFEPVVIDVETRRAGRTASSFRAEVSQAGRPVLDAMVWSAGANEGLEHDETVGPDVPGPDGLASIGELVADERARVPFPFWENFDRRPVRFEPAWPPDGPRPAVWHEWLRFVPTSTFSDPWVDAARSVILVDLPSWPSAHRPHAWQQPPFTAPSLDLNVAFHRPTGGEEWLLCDGAAPLSTNGLFGWTARVWSGKGRLHASGGGQCLYRRTTR